MGRFAFLRPKEEGILCCLPLGLACGSPVFSTQWKLFYCFDRLKKYLGSVINQSHVWGVAGIAQHTKKHFYSKQSFAVQFAFVFFSL